MIPGKRVAVIIIAQHGGVEDLGDIGEAWYFVGSGAAGYEGARVGGPEGFFEGEEAEALEEGAFDLAVVDGGVDGVAYVLLSFY